MTKYTTLPANEGTKTCLMVGWIVKAVFVDPDHADLAKRVAELLNDFDETKAARRFAEEAR